MKQTKEQKLPRTLLSETERKNAKLSGILFICFGVLFILTIILSPLGIVMVIIGIIFLRMKKYDVITSALFNSFRNWATHQEHQRKNLKKKPKNKIRVIK